MGKILVFALICMFIVCIPVFASDKQTEWKQLTVPNEISTKQEIVSTPEGWASTKEARPNRLSSISISEGPPENMATLVYDSEVKRKNKLILTWQFATIPKEHLWITCSYSATNIVITKQLPDDIKELRVSYDDSVKTDGLPTIEKIEYH